MHRGYILEYSSLEAAVKQERPRLFDFIRRRVRTDEDAEDLLQDVFSQLADNADVVESIESIAAWLFTVARNRVTDWYRKRKTVLPGGPHQADDDRPSALDLLLGDSDGNPELVYERDYLWSEIIDALDELPAEQREAFVGNELEGKSFKEMAEESGESINTLLSRKHYAVLRLRNRLQDLYDEYHDKEENV